MPPDIKRYLHHFDGFDLSAEDKEELALTLWSTMEILVDRAIVVSEANAPEHAPQQSHVLEFNERVQGCYSLSLNFTQTSRPAAKKGRKNDQ